MTAEQKRLAEARENKASWKKWGPYLSERQWGTVREDYSADGNAWDYFTHDQARARAYRWGEDGLAGVSDDKQLVCVALALWNGRDPVIKERLFGLTNSEGNHGEDVKEYYFYLDSTPTHSYMKYLYKYPQAAYPYDELVRTNKTRGREGLEYELLDTGVFNDNRYFDVFVEYAKAAPEDLLIEITVHNRGPEAATLHVLPTIWFRNIWSWGGDVLKPELFRVEGSHTVALTHSSLGRLFFHADGAADLLFTENDTNNERIFGTPNRCSFVKDGINDYIVHGKREAVNSNQTGTKASAHYPLTIAAGESQVVRLRLNDVAPGNGSGRKPSPDRSAKDFDAVMEARRREADEFYASVIPSSFNEDQARVMRQALAGMLWTKQFFHYDVEKWLEERGADPFRGTKRAPRNQSWHHMHNADIISMPDKWEYPWYAAWDLAFHVLALTLVDEDFGKHQLDLMLREDYLHPSGQIPAYEWNFGDVNPPVHAWATIFTHRLLKGKNETDVDWLERSFHKLLLNFTWWVNRKDPSGRNAFEGGFLGLDNIGVFDRSSPLPTGGHLEQADGTAWMALFCQNMLEIAMELSLEKPAYAEMADKFISHYLWIARAMVFAGDGVAMWDEEDGFFYDVVRLPDGSSQRLKVRSMVGLLPLCAGTVFPGTFMAKFPEVADRLRAFIAARPELRQAIQDPVAKGVGDRRLASVLDEGKLRRVLARMLDENEFLSPYGIRALSRHHAEHPFVFRVGDQEYGVGYLPGESDSGMFGGNSNWRGPIWMPVNGLIIRALLQYYLYYGDAFKVECPTGSGRMMTLYEVAEDLGRRLAGIFLRDSSGRRPVYGGTTKFQEDPHWRDLVLFFEYFHGDNGAGLGASHQTGWTGIVARIMHLFATMNAEEYLELGKWASAGEARQNVTT
jgi:Mannosylglycerate hydrolase MGH1-like glycoside hydrolase domain